eukprot:Gregarina_sp_Poly_1__2754@NODE_1764_length_3381_cov_98_503923_g1152_i0_p1_GENE_NODE_1764_length_3381_cov_98_503923_g1152_i0NODE_1764_length_3381_cov_98_503923_g1152_i0_p1_ORF_typecomplete_len508_score51_54EGF_CA/PF07645_15/0_00011EGF_CA/PF07645_15/4_3e08EGF_CA/PF07645_15/28EGF_CA/PF07645_15/1_5e04cEGF/PF12662_7/2_7e09cEGF/PF12662_7/1_9e03cEGF/PF12662_7/9_9e02FXa_inhibition/PF14670_6/5_2e03FXa_inhibition/PF14670_6/3_6e06FXa_inhibition/PF14670_6/3_9FXa_inhibition/PF14670_6/5_5e03EGF_3/PF12947_7/0_
MKEYNNGECILRDICYSDGGAQNPCDRENGVCVNTVEGAQCFCKEGFRLASDGRHCEDVDECAEGLHQCDLSISRCMNKAGGYSCVCDESAGYSNLPDSDIHCGNLNECERYPDVCNDPTLPCCLDLPPPQKFVCRPGFWPISSPPSTPFDQQTWQPMGFIEAIPELAHVAVEDVDSLKDWYETSRNHLLHDLGITPRDRSDSVRISTMLQDWIPPALHHAAEPLFDKWTPPAMKEIAQQFALKSSELKKGLQGMGMGFPYGLGYTLGGRHFESIPAWRQLHFLDHSPDISPAPPSIFPLPPSIFPPANMFSATPRSLSEEEPISLVRKFAEAAIDAAPGLVRPGLLALPGPARSFFAPGHAIQCPAGHINVITTKRQRKVEQIPDQAEQVWNFFKNLMKFSPSNLDANSVAVGVATNLNSIANKLAEWYKTFAALPDALGGAASNLTSLSIVDDLDNALKSGASAVKPMVNAISNVAQQIPNVRDDLLEAIPRGSGPIFAPIANDF